MSRRLAVGAGVIAMVVALAPPASADQGSAVLGAVRDDGGRLGQVVVVAGTGREGYSGDGWSAREARIGAFTTLSVAPDGTLYLADRAQGRVRMVTTGGTIDTVSGTVKRRPHEDDPAFAGWLHYPSDRPNATAVGADGSLYIAGSETITRRLPDGTTVRIAGGGTLGDLESGPALDANFINPTDLAVDAAGNVYVADVYAPDIRRIDTNGTITTIAGGGTLEPAAAQGRPATEVSLKGVTTVAVDSAGTVYFANGTDAAEVRVVGKITPDGTYTTVMSTEVDGAVYGGIALDGDDNLYVNDFTNGVISKVTPDGTVTNVGPSRGSVDIAVGPDGDIYSSGESRVHRLVRHGQPPAQTRPARGESRWAGRAPGTVETVFGTGQEPAEDFPIVDDTPGPDQVAVAPDGTVYYVDASRSQVGAVAPDGTTRVLAGQWKDPASIAVGPDGGIHVIDRRDTKIHRIDPGGTVETVAGTTDPQAVTVDAAGILYVTDGLLVRRIGADGISSTLVGGGDRWADTADGQPATAASLGEPTTITVDQNGTVYFIDDYHSVIWRVGPDGVLHTAAGGAFRVATDGGFAGDGGPADRAEINSPRGLATGPDGSLYIADTHNNRVRRVTPDGVISTFAGTGEPAEEGDDGPAVEAALLEPTGVAVGHDGTVYVTSPVGGTIRRISPTGTITSFARFPASPNEDRPATEVDLRQLDGLTVDGAGTPGVVVFQDQLYSADESGRLHIENVRGSHVVTGPDGSTYVAGQWSVDRRYPDGTVVPVMGYGSVQEVADGRPAIASGMLLRDLAAGPDGEVYVAGEEQVYRIDPDGVLDLVLDRPVTGMAVGADGTLYAADYVENQVLRVSDGEVTTFAGVGGYAVSSDTDLGDGGPATEAVVWSPSDVAVAPDGTVFVSSSDGIRRITPDGTIETIVHPAGESTGDGPKQLALDAHGNLYFTEPQLFRVRVVVGAGEMEIPGFGWGTMWLGVNLAVAAFVFVVVRRRRLLEEMLGQPE